VHGLVFLGERQLTLREFPDPEPGPGEAVVAIAVSGMCGSDLHSYRSAEPPSCIGGHEPAGVVHALGVGVDPRLAQVGDRVTVHHYAGCAVCDQCRSGWFQLCRRGAVRYGADANGSHAPYMLVPAATLVRLPDSIGFEAGAAIGCGTGTAWGALRRLGDLGGATLAVIGQGAVGLSATMLASRMGARVVAIDPAPERRRQATRFGAFAVLDPAEADAGGAVLDITDGRGAELVLETSGSAPGAATALAALGTWGRACFVGLGGGKVELDVASMLPKQPTVMTSWTLSISELSRCVEFVAQREVPVADLITRRWVLDQAEEAYSEFDRQVGGKGVLLFPAR
jgi:threonine dehydrogenase-like Zn-dependent dehydrogenase